MFDLRPRAVSIKTNERKKLSMNKKSSRILTIALAAALVAAIAIPAAAAGRAAKELTAYPGITMYMDGAELQPKDANGNPVDVFIVDGTTYLPARALTEALGGQIGFDSASYSIYMDTVAKDDKAAEYLEAYFDVTAATSFNDALKAIFGDDAAQAEDATVGAAVKAAVENCGLKELALAYPAEKTAASTTGVVGVAEATAPYVAAALNASLASGTWDFSAELNSDTAAQLLMNAVDIAGLGRNYLGKVSDPDIARKLQSAWKTFGNFDDAVLSQLGADLVIAEASTGYNLKYDGYNANFLDEYTIQYGHSDITHAVQLLALLNSEGIDAKVALEPKTSIYEYMVDWGDPTLVTNSSTYALKPIEGTERWLCYATEYDMMLEFDTMAEKNAFDALIERYSKKYSVNQNEDGSFTPSLIYGAWWNPLYSSYVPMEDEGAFTHIYDNVIRNGEYTIHPFSVVDDTAGIAAVVAEKTPDLAVELVDLYVNNAFHRYLTHVSGE